MPWFPDFVAAAEQARRLTRTAGQADPVAQYLTALSTGHAGALEAAWPGEVVIYDPRAARSAAPCGCGASSGRIERGWPSATPPPRRWRRRVPGRAGRRRTGGASGPRRRGCALAAGRRRRISGRSIRGVPHVLQPAGRSTATAPSGHPSSSRRTLILVTWSAGTRRPWTLATSTRSSAPSRGRVLPRAHRGRRLPLRHSRAAHVLLRVLSRRRHRSAALRRDR